MRLVILTQYYPPEVGAPQTRLSELAQLVAKRGHSITVLTAMPNYPTGKIHAGYGGILKRERHAGVRIIRTFIYPTQKADFTHRLANYFSFVISSTLFGTFLLRRSEYLLVESPPLFLGLAGFWLSRVKRTRMIFNVSDLWPDSAVHLDIIRRESRAFTLSSWLEAFCYHRAWLITGQARSILADIEERFPACRTLLLSNGVDTLRFGPHFGTKEARQILGPEKRFVALYTGLHGLAQGLEQVLGAAQMLRDDRDLGFVLVGDGPEKATLQKEAREKGLNNVTFLDPVAKDRIPALLAAADVILVTLKTFIPGAVPSKLYEAMATCRPVVLVASGEAAEIVKRYNAGIVIEPGDMPALTRALSALRDSPELCRELGSNGRRAAEEHFDRTRIVNSFTDYLERHLNT